MDIIRGFFSFENNDIQADALKRCTEVYRYQPILFLDRRQIIWTKKVKNITKLKLLINFLIT